MHGIAAALALFLLAFLLRLALGRMGMKAPLPFATFAPVVLVAPLIGGIWAGVSVIVLSGLSAWFIFLPAGPTPSDSSNLIVMATYILTSLMIIAVMHLLDQEFERLIAERQRSENLFQELQHRISNNLQTVSTILRLQEREIDDAESGRAALRDAGGRLATIGALHRRLYDPGVQSIDIGAHLKSLCADILSAAGAGSVVCRVEAYGGATLPAARALTLSLIVNEAVVNALKYAFPAGGRGVVVVSLLADGTDYLLEVADDGVGLNGKGPVDESLGTRIVTSLSAQLGGEPEWRTDVGTTFSLRFPR